MIKKRGKNPDEILEALSPIYDVIGSVPRRMANSPIVRLGLVPK